MFRKCIFNNTDKWLIFIAGAIGFLAFFIPIQYIIVLLIAALVSLYLLLNPKKTYFLAIFFSLFTYPFRIGSQYLPFTQADILITICLAGVILKMMMNKERVDLSTKLDWLLFLLFILYMYSGLTSATHRGYQWFLRFGEILALYYLTIYFIRTKTLSIASILKCMIYTMLFQSILGLMQTTTGSFSHKYPTEGEFFRSNRNILGYLGIGSPLAWQAHGTLSHFNGYGLVMTTFFSFYLSIFYNFIKNKSKGLMIMAIFLMGIYVCFSRSAYLGLCILPVPFIFLIAKNKLKVLLYVLPLAMIVAFTYFFLSDTNYVQTIHLRDRIWNVALHIIQSNPETFWLGSGLDSFKIITVPYLGDNLEAHGAHNIFLAIFFEMGLAGLVLYMLFFAVNFSNLYKVINGRKSYIYTIAVGVFLYLFSTILMGIFNHTFIYFYPRVWLFLVLALFYAKVDSGYKKYV